MTGLRQYWERSRRANIIVSSWRINVARIESNERGDDALAEAEAEAERPFEVVFMGTKGEREEGMPVNAMHEGRGMTAREHIRRKTMRRGGRCREEGMLEGPEQGLPCWIASE
jgi:hypothetical protein